VFDELPEHLVVERKNLEHFHKSTVEEPYHEFLTTFPLQSSYIIGIETLQTAAERLFHLSDLNKKKSWSNAPKTKFCYTTLHEVVRSGDLKSLQSIADDYPVDLNCQSRSGRTALHYAVLMGHDDIIGFLLSRKVDVSLVDKAGCNALHLAVALNRESLAKALLTLGLDFSQKNNAGHRPLEIMALNVLGYKSTNLYKHLIKLIIKRQTGIVERWLDDLYSCGIFEMLMSPRDLTGTQLLQLQDENSEAFIKKWKNLQTVMDPNFKSTGRSTLPGQGFRDDRPSSLVNGRFLELWSKYYDSLKLGCKPTVICKISKKTEPDTVHLKYEIRGIRKGRYDPEFIDMGLMVVNLKDDLILKEDVDPDISVEQPAIVKPSSSGATEKPKKERKQRQRIDENCLEYEASDNDEDIDEASIIEQEIQSMIEIIDIVSQMTSAVEALHLDGEIDAVKIIEQEISLHLDGEIDAVKIIEQEIVSMIEIIDVVRQLASTVEEMHSKTLSVGEINAHLADVNTDSIKECTEQHSTAWQFTQRQMPEVENSQTSANLSVKAVLDTIISEIEQNSKTSMQPMTTQESRVQESENGEDQAKKARFLRDGPIVDLRSLPWESQSARFQNATISLENQTNCTESDETAAASRHLHGQPINEVSLGASVESTVDKILSDSTKKVPALNFANPRSNEEKQAR
jgi:hypothetical protein